jgi:hypothetical protein
VSAARCGHTIVHVKVVVVRSSFRVENVNIMHLCTPPNPPQGDLTQVTRYFAIKLPLRGSFGGGMRAMRVFAVYSAPHAEDSRARVNKEYRVKTWRSTAFMGVGEKASRRRGG